MKQARISESVGGHAYVTWCLPAIVVLAALVAGGVAQERRELPGTAARALRPATPTTVPQTQPAMRPQKAAPKPTVVLQPGEVPAISFEQAVWDFGRVKAGEAITHEFAFTNTGNGSLEILEVKPG